MRRPAEAQPPAWPHRELLLQRQQQLLLRSAELRGELASELRAGWRRAETSLDLILRLRGLWIELRQRGRDLREQHPWLVATLVFWPPLLRRIWRFVRRAPAAPESDRDRPGTLGRVARLIQLLRWTRRAMALWRRYSAAAD